MPNLYGFLMKVAQGAMKIEQCPHMSDEALASLSEATAPPMKTIKIGTGAEEHTWVEKQYYSDMRKHL